MEPQLVAFLLFSIATSGTLGLQLALISFAVCLPCVAAWAGLGAGAGRLLATRLRLRLFNIAMALLLLASLWPMLADI